MNLLAHVGRFVGFVLRTARGALAQPVPVAEVVEQSWRIGIRSLPILGVIAVFVGTNLALQGHAAFRPLGGGRLVGMFVALAGVRELAPIIAAAMVAAKAGTEMAGQIAVMRNQEQIDALEVMAVDPYAWLIVPRFLGILLVMPALTTLAVFVTLASSWAVAVGQLHLNGDAFLQLVTASIAPADFAWATLKALVFAAVICLVSCYFGFTAGPGARGVGRATNAAVVTAAVVCVVLNVLISRVAYA